MNILEAIEFYHARGYNIVPLVKGTKVPIKDLKLEDYFDTKYPIDKLREIAENQQINIGIITGKTSNLAVVDVDNPDKINTYLIQYPTDLIQKTPSGGAHLLYNYNELFPDIRKIEGGDFFAGKHYIVASPSTFNGLSYEWLKLGEAGTLPTELFIRQINIQTGKYTRQEILDLLNYAMENGKPKEGMGNDTILYGSTILAGDGWTQKALLYLMRNINRNRQHPESDRVVDGMVIRALEYASKNTYQKETVKQSKPSIEIELNISSYGSIMTRFNNHKTAWMVEDWLLESSVMICAAPPERYKTWLAVDLALSVASGLPFLGVYEVKKTGNVLVFQQEDFSQRYFSRFEAVEKSKLYSAHLEATIEQRDDGAYIYTTPYDLSDKIFFHTDSEFTLDNDQAIDKLEQRIVETDAKLCIIDPFYSLGSSEDYFASIAQKIREKIKDIRNKTGCGFFFVHHTRKSGTNEQGDAFGRNQIFGSQFVSAVMEGSWLMGRTQGMGNNEVMAYRRFKDENAPPATRIGFNINMTEEENPYIIDITEVADDMMVELRDYLDHHGAQTFSDIFELFGDRFNSRSAFTRWLRGLVGHGINQDGKKGKYFSEPDGK